MKPPRPHPLFRFVLAAGLVAALVAMPASPVGARGESRVDIDAFMTGLEEPLAPAAAQGPAGGSG